MNLDKNTTKNILILGALDGIGLAISKVLDKSNHNIYVTSRKKYKSSSNIKFLQLIATKEDNWKKLTNFLDEKKIKFDLIINTIGVLQDKENEILPEKSIRDFNKDSFIKNIEANTLVTALCFKYLINYTSKINKVIIASLSARLGSISDNNIGGWISYRASKAAQNMIIRTTSIELKRTNKNIILVGLHPGTVKTKLSEPFIKFSNKVYTPVESAHNLLNVIEKLNYDDSGKIYDYSGKIVPF